MSAHRLSKDGVPLQPADDTRRLAVVIPAYNEAGTIRDVATRALSAVARVIVVDDGSNDQTATALAGLAVTVLRHERNRGKAASLRRGIACALDAAATAVITLDGDGQHLPEDISRLVATHRAHPDAIVVGARLRGRDQAPRARVCANRFANFWIAWAAGQAIADSQSGFRLYPVAALRKLDLLDNRAAGFVFESEVLIDAGRAGIRIIAVPVDAIYPPDRRRSHMRPVADILAITRMVAWKLASRGLYLQGLVRSLRPDTSSPEDNRAAPPAARTTRV